MRKITVILFCFLLALCCGCSTATEETTEDPGFYDLDNGRVRAVGTLERVELEGGFWAVVEPTTSDSNQVVIAVIANAEEFTAQIAELDPSYVAVTGTLFEGASIRMSGPEIVADTIEELTAP